jgi:hypothetical protein
MNWFLLLAFVAMSFFEAFQFGRALLTRRVRRITFRALFVTAEDDSATFWAATVYHAFAALCVAGMALIWAQQPGLLK